MFSVFSYISISTCSNLGLNRMAWYILASADDQSLKQLLLKHILGTHCNNIIESIEKKNILCKDILATPCDTCSAFEHMWTGKAQISLHICAV